MLCSGAIGVLRYTCGMFIKLTRSKSRTYAQLVESFRDEQGQPRQRTVATLGRVDEDGGTVDAVLSTLLRAKGRSGVDIATPQVRFESALALGDVWALEIGKHTSELQSHLISYAVFCLKKKNRHHRPQH